MSGGLSVKRRGTSFEYRVANYFAGRQGWNGLRNPLSGASSQIKEGISLHDVRAWHNTLPIFFQIEAKKRGKTKDPKKRDVIEIKREWTNGIDFNKDELLVVATDRSDMYVFIPTKRLFQVLGRSYPVEYSKEQIFNGGSQFLFKRTSVDNSPNKRFHLLWERDEFVILLLEEFVTLRETANLNDELSLEDQIKRLMNIDKALEFEKLHLNEFNYTQKRLLYSKLEELESGSFINPIAHSNDQFWLNDSFVVVCPHCSEKITKKDLKPD
jgi:Holliday junction resolvase